MDDELLKLGDEDDLTNEDCDDEYEEQYGEELELKDED
jgi:hypothetical protein